MSKPDECDCATWACGEFSNAVAALNTEAMGDQSEWDRFGRATFGLAQKADEKIARLERELAKRPPIECSTEMAHAMSRLDGWDRDRDMPGLQKWIDYWDAAVAAKDEPEPREELPGCVWRGAATPFADNH